MNSNNCMFNKRTYRMHCADYESPTVGLIHMSQVHFYNGDSNRHTIGPLRFQNFTDFSPDPDKIYDEDMAEIFADLNEDVFDDE